MTDGQTEARPERVPYEAKRAGDIQARWAWVEPSVWTERMLTALEEGVQGSKWYSLMDKVYALTNLRMAFARVKANQGAAGVDHQTIQGFEQHLEENLARLSQALKDGTYRPQAVRRVWIDKLGSKDKRPLGIPTVVERVAQGALRHVLEPIFERDFAEQSYGFRPGRSCKDALRRVDERLKAGYVWIVDADLKSYFDTIPWTPLIERIQGKISDGRVLDLLKAYLNTKVMDGLKDWTPEEGSPQGAMISPLLSNIYLDPLDHEMAQAGYEMVRYADDFVILCRSQAEAEEALEKVRQWTASAGLTLHPVKTRIVDASQSGGFDFLGYHFERGMKWPRKKSLDKFRDAIRVKTRRANGQSLGATIAEMNRTLIGWFGYFKHSGQDTFRIQDGWVRMRLRSILRRRQGRTGIGHGFDHLRWPNAFFAKQGLFSLKSAHAQLCQSLTR